MRKQHENSFKKYLVARLKGHWDVQSIEDRHTPGIPDLNYCADGTEGWIELKTILDWPAKEDTTLHTPLKHLTNEQCNWMKRRSNHGGRVFILMKVISTKEYLLFYGQEARELKSATRMQATAMALMIWDDSIPPVELIIEIAG